MVIQSKAILFKCQQANKGHIWDVAEVYFLPTRQESRLSRITDGTFQPAAYIDKVQEYAGYCDDCKLSVQMKLKGETFTNMINNIQVLGQVHYRGQNLNPGSCLYRTCKEIH